MIHYFYKITNLVNNRYYYGVHSQEDNVPDVYMGSVTALELAFKKYGKNNFKKDILKYFDSRDEALDWEGKIVTEDLIREPLCYNIARGGNGGVIFHTEESKRKMADKLNQYWNDGRSFEKRVIHGNRVRSSPLHKKAVERIIEQGLVKGAKNPSYGIAQDRYFRDKDRFCY